MSAPAPVSWRMIKIVPENGYESPLDEFSLQPKPVRGQRHRLACRHDGVGLPAEGESRESQMHDINRSGGENQQGEAAGIRTVGLRDRIGCYTWTWFTMTMATGGIANVLHSCNASDLRVRSTVHLSRLTLFSSV
jgi:hypothetical protein